MKRIFIALGFILKVAVILLYCCTKGAELILTAFNRALKKTLDL